MESFKQFLEQEKFIEFILNEFNRNAAIHPVGQVQKPWSAKKPEILQMWKNLRADTPIIIQPLSDMKMTSGGSSYSEDGIRITGSWYFISSVLSRLKELAAYENPRTKLRLVLRGVDKSKGARPDQQSFVFYLNAENRARGKAGRPKLKVPTI